MRISDTDPIQRDASVTEKNPGNWEHLLILENLLVALNAQNCLVCLTWERENV